MEARVRESARVPTHARTDATSALGRGAAGSWGRKSWRQSRPDVQTMICPPRNSRDCGSGLRFSEPGCGRDLRNTRGREDLRLGCGTGGKGSNCGVRGTSRSPYSITSYPPNVRYGDARPGQSAQCALRHFGAPRAAGWPRRGSLRAPHATKKEQTSDASTVGIYGAPASTPACYSPKSHT